MNDTPSGHSIRLQVSLHLLSNVMGSSFNLTFEIECHTTYFSEDESALGLCLSLHFLFKLVFMLFHFTVHGLVIKFLSALSVFNKPTRQVAEKLRELKEINKHVAK